MVLTHLAKIGSLDVIEISMTPAMDVVSDKFGSGEIFISEIMANAFEEVMTLLNRKILESGRCVNKIGNIAIGSVQTDIHVIG